MDQAVEQLLDRGVRPRRLPVIGVVVAGCEGNNGNCRVKCALTERCGSASVKFNDIAFGILVFVEEVLANLLQIIRTRQGSELPRYLAYLLRRSFGLKPEALL